MKLFLNNQELKTSLPPQATLAVALQSVQEQFLAENEIISGIMVDNEELTAEKLSQWKQRPAADFGEIHIEAYPRGAYAADGLRILAQNLMESKAHRQEIVDHLGQGRTKEAMDLLVGYMQTWYATQQSLGSVCRLMQIDLDHLEILDNSESQSPQSIRVKDQIDQLSEHLTELKSALEAGDFVLLGDILEYEFGPLTDSWQNTFEQLADHLETQN